MHQQPPKSSDSPSDRQEQEPAPSGASAPFATGPLSPAQGQGSAGGRSQKPLNQGLQGAPSLEGKSVGNYRFVKRIGGGGFGDVYRAEHVELGNPFAIKVLHKHLAKDQPFVERFRTEAMVLAGLQHENVVSVVDFGQSEEVGFYLVMEWLEGRTLHRVWRRKRNFPLSQIYALFSQLLDALDAAHKSGIVHRDMKPENLMLTRGSRGRSILKIVDFGIATMVRGKGGSLGPNPEEGLIVGTPYYMSPEQASGRHKDVDGRADIYACGVILFELLTGRRLYASKDPKEVLQHQINTQPPQLDSIPGKHPYSPMLQAVLDRALAKDLRHRYASAAEMFAEFEIAMQSEGVQPDDREIDLRQLRGVASQTSLLALAVGSESLLLDEGESLSTGAGYRGQKATASGSMEMAPVEEEAPILPSSKALWLPVVGGVGLVALLFLLLGLQPWSTKPNLSKSGLSLPPVVQAPTIERDSAPKKRPVQTPKTIKSQPDKDKPPQKSKANKRRRKRRISRRRRRRISRRRRRRISRRRRRISKGTRLFRIVTVPGVASVYVNGKYRGKTPKLLRLEYGQSFSIVLKKKGFVSQKFRWRATRNFTKRTKLIEDLF